MEANQTCKTCVFSSDWDSERSGLGNCHRYPPTRTFEAVVNVPDLSINGIIARLQDAETTRPQNSDWPLVFADDWCGEFKPVKPPVVPIPKLNEFGFSVRVMNIFKYRAKPKINSTEILLERTVDDLIRLINFGEMSLTEVREKLAKFGLKLKGD